jgi:hypothetical protein
MVNSKDFCRVCIIIHARCPVSRVRAMNEYALPSSTQYTYLTNIFPVHH